MRGDASPWGSRGVMYRRLVLGSRDCCCSCRRRRAVVCPSVYGRTILVTVGPSLLTAALKSAFSCDIALRQDHSYFLTLWTLNQFLEWIFTVFNHWWLWPLPQPRRILKAFTIIPDSHRSFQITTLLFSRISHPIWKECWVWTHNFRGHTPFICSRGCMRLIWTLLPLPQQPPQQPPQPPRPQLGVGVWTPHRYPRHPSPPRVAWAHRGRIVWEVEGTMEDMGAQGHRPLPHPHRIPWMYRWTCGLWFGII